MARTRRRVALARSWRSITFLVELRRNPRNRQAGLAQLPDPFLALARATDPLPRIDDILLPIQRDLLAIGALLATPNPTKMREQLVKARVDDSRIRELERAIDDGDLEIAPLKAFIIPGGSSKAALLHVCRTVCRRAERSVVSLQETEAIPELAIIYLNRLSDLLFTLARVANARAGSIEETW